MANYEVCYMEKVSMVRTRSVRYGASSESVFISQNDKIKRKITQCVACLAIRHGISLF